MGFNDRLIFAQPEFGKMYVERVPVADTKCPVCSSSDVRRYPIGYFLGPRIVVKCQECFHSLSVERPTLEDNWPPFRAASYDWEPSPSESVGGDRRRAQQAERKTVSES